MKQAAIETSFGSVPVTVLDTAVIGSGCAGLNAADWLHMLGRREIAIVTEGILMGTSRNTGSDKQTYYKLSLASDGEDSVRQLADTLFAGGGVHGDIALAEAAGSARSFIKLANLGVPFPTNEYGEYIGYKTDHDPRRRATSAGPLTSKYMTECLERSVREKGIPILNGMMAVELLVEAGTVWGVICMEKSGLAERTHGLHIICARNVLLATGGPAACYAASVYPESQTGMTGMAVRAGVKMANLQEWQYGLASVKFRWNVSGTYQQVLPRYISIDAEGKEREFLNAYLDDPFDALDRVFLKGYQWPFDAKKVRGSSLVDLLVHHETQALGRRVYMDFRRNPTGLPEGFHRLSAETTEYLGRSDALFGTPIERLERMNPDAIALYASHGIDLRLEPLEVAVCAQHHNGGIAVDANWQTSVRGLFASGEAAGTFGAVRPGGSALNATQVGSLRAAEAIAWDTAEDVSMPEGFAALAGASAERLLGLFERMQNVPEGGEDALQVGEGVRRRMSKVAAHIRDIPEMRAFSGDLSSMLARFAKGEVRVSAASELIPAMKVRDTMTVQRALLSAMLLSADEQGSHGSALVLDEAGESPVAGLPAYAFRPYIAPPFNAVMETVEHGEGPVSSLAPVREMPKPEDWFETAWAKYRARREKNART